MQTSVCLCYMLSIANIQQILFGSSIFFRKFHLHDEIRFKDSIYFLYVAYILLRKNISR